MCSFGLGWLREPPDHRDYIIDEHPDTKKFFAPDDAVFTARARELPESADIRRYCSPIENQGALGSCTAQAVIGCAEFLHNRYRRPVVDGSRLFLYKVTRNVLGWTGDTGAYIRTTMHALGAFGAPPERYWPHNIADFDVEPTPFAYSYARAYRGLCYYRHDRNGRSREDLLEMIKRMMSYALPVVFGFTVYDFGDDGGNFHMPEPGQRPYGGHAIVAVGYDDNHVIDDVPGALLIRNSWGTGWGQDGYGWLPYGYVLEGLSSDFWTLYNVRYAR